jgi:Ca2+-binding EF-hand superfamily protein
MTASMVVHVTNLTPGSGGNPDHREFTKALKSAEVGLTKKEINLLLSEVDFNDDGVIEYAEFVPICFELLVERATNKQMENAAFSSHDGLTQLLLDAFLAADLRGRVGITGVLPIKDIKSTIKELAEDEELSLSRSQIVSIVSMCDISPEGTVRYAAFAPVAADVIYGMIDFDSQKKRAEAVTQLASGDNNIAFMRDLTAEQIEGVMMQAFLAADADGSGSLDRVEMYGVLKAVGTVGRCTLNQVDP